MSRDMEMFLRKISWNLIFRAARMGEKDALYSIQNGHVFENDLGYTNISFANFLNIYEKLEDSCLNCIDSRSLEPEDVKSLFKYAVGESDKDPSDEILRKRAYYYPEECFSDEQLEEFTDSDSPRKRPASEVFSVPEESGYLKRSPTTIDVK